MKYLVNSINCRMAVDSYNDGQNPETEEYWDEQYTFYGKTIEEVVGKVLDFYDMDKENATVFDDRILVNNITDADRYPLNEEELELWKKNEITGYSFEIDFMVYGLIEHDELVATTKIESYD